MGYKYGLGLNNSHAGSLELVGNLYWYLNGNLFGIKCTIKQTAYIINSKEYFNRGYINWKHQESSLANINRM